MRTVLLILAIVVTLACLIPIFFGVYVDHVRKRRRDGLTATYRTAAQNRQACRDSLRVIGGACADGKPGLR